MYIKRLWVNVFSKYFMFFIIFCLSSCSFNHSNMQIKVACVGDSITFGATIENREQNSYPAQLGQLLGKDWEVKNFGVIGSTLLKNGDWPYWKQKPFNEAKVFNPDVVIIKLGTNDTKPYNWKFKNEYIADYIAMINEFRVLPSKPYIFICLPVPAYSKLWGISDSTIRADIIPMIISVGKKNNAPVINLYKPLSNHVEWFTDKIHPNAAGAGEIAKIINKMLLKNKKNIEKRKM